MPSTTPSAHRPPSAPALPLRRGVAANSGEKPNLNLFDGGDTLADDDTMRSNWAVPWSDLMMTMFVLFAALLAAHTPHGRGERNKPADAQVAPPAPLAQAKPAPALPENPAAPASESATAAAAAPLTPASVLEKSQDALRDADLKNVQIAEFDDKSVQVRMQGAMFFAAGGAELRPEVTTLLDRLALVIKDTPYDIQVVGHTDDREINPVPSAGNWELSLARAGQVAHRLIEVGGIDPSRFMVVGRGKYHPLSPNTDEPSRALNRRVEIIITRHISKPGNEEIP